MKERIRNWYYLFVGDFFIKMYERIWYYRWHRAKWNWVKKLADKGLEELTWSIIDNHMDLIRDDKKNNNVEMTITSADEKSPFYGGLWIHAAYDERGHMQHGEWFSV